MPRHMISVFCLLSLAASLAAPTAAESEDQRLTLFVTSGLSGQLERDDGVTAAALATRLKSLADEARANGHAVAVIDAGRTLAPFAESRFDRGETMVHLLGAAGCQAFVPATLDLSLGLARLGELAAGASFPFLRAFDSEHPAAAELQASARLTPMPGLELVLTSHFDPSHADDAKAASGAAIELLDHRDTNAAGALRIGVLHSVSREPALKGQDFTWQWVENPGAVDLLIQPNFGHDLTLRRQDAAGPVFLAGFDRQGHPSWTIRRLVLDLRSQGTGWRISDLELETLELIDVPPGDPELVAAVGETMRRFDESYDVPLPSGAPGEQEALEAFVLDAVREKARAEVAVLNTNALRPLESAYFDPPLTRETVARLLSLDQSLVIVSMSGDALSKLAASSAASDRPLRFSGLEKDGDKVRVQGRGVQAKDLYRVVTNDYLVAGGDGYDNLTGLKAKPLETAEGRPVEVREDVVMPRLEDASRGFPELGRHVLFRYGLNKLTLSFEGVETRRDDAYLGVSDSRARASDSSSIYTDLELWGDLDWASFRLENRLDASFGVLNTESSSEEETDDDLALETSAIFTRLKVPGGGNPYASVKLDTELRPGRDGTGASLPRQFERSLSAGVTWSKRLFPVLRLGAVARQLEGGQPNSFGVTAEAKFLWQPKDRRPGLDIQMLYESLEGDGITSERLDFELDVVVPVWGDLSLTPSFNYYNFSRSDLPGSADYLKVAVGLTYSWRGRNQVGAARPPRGR